MLKLMKQVDAHCRNTLKLRASYPAGKLWALLTRVAQKELYQWFTGFGQTEAM